MKIDWINSWSAENKKEQYRLELRLGTLTVFEIKVKKGRLRFMILNVGFEI